MSIWFTQPRKLRESERERELIGDDYGGIPASVIFVDAEPGHGPRLHKHAYAELFFILDGEATFTDGVEEPGRIEGGKAIEHWSVRDDLGQAL